MRAKIVYWALHGLARQEIIDAVGPVKSVDLTIVATLEELLAALPGTKGLILYDAPEKSARQVVAALNAPENSVEWLHFISTGRDGFERVGLPNHITITGPGSATAPAVAEHALALTLATLRAIPQALGQAQERVWTRAIVRYMASMEGRTVTVIGYGAIGKKLVSLLKPLQPRLTVVTRTPPESGEDAGVPIRPLLDLPDVIKTSEIVIVTIALTRETSGMFDRELLSAIPQGGYFINVARGELTDLQAVEDLLRSGHLAGVALDVLAPEPFPEDSTLWTAPNLIVTPHVAAAGSRPGARRLGEAARAHLVAMLDRQSAEA